MQSLGHPPRPATAAAVKPAQAASLLRRPGRPVQPPSAPPVARGGGYAALALFYTTRHGHICMLRNTYSRSSKKYCKSCARRVAFNMRPSIA